MNVTDVKNNILSALKIYYMYEITVLHRQTKCEVIKGENTIMPNKVNRNYM